MRWWALVPLLLMLAGCKHAPAPLAPTRYGSAVLGTNPLRGDLVPVHDPALARQGATWYLFTTDNTFAHEQGYLQVRCSPDLRVWHRCGFVFGQIPAWVHQEIPEAQGLWAPDVSYFNGQFHLYYAVSTLGSQHSAIGVAASSSLGHGWVDQGEVMRSRPGDKSNALDPSVVSDGNNLWLVYGSFAGGIFERRLDPAAGKLDGRDQHVYHLAAQPRSRGRAIEGASLIKHDGWFYLFASVGVCCDLPIERDTYQQIVGRSRSVHGPFTAEDGGELLHGGGTVLLTTGGDWLAPGGGSAYVDPATNQAYLTFHALKRSENGALYAWVKALAWEDGWPVLRDP